MRNMQCTPGQNCKKDHRQQATHRTSGPGTLLIASDMRERTMESRRRNREQTQRESDADQTHWPDRV